MRAEGPKERPTAAKCSAEYTLCPNTADHKNSKYYALADITSLRFIVYYTYVRAFRYRYRAILQYGTPRVSAVGGKLRYSSQPSHGPSDADPQA